MSQKQALQNAHSTKFLNYGHLGRTTYDQEEKTWKTLRSIESHSTLAAAGRRFGDESHTAFPLRHLSSKVVYEGFAASQCQNGSQNYGRNCDDTAQSGSGPNGTSIPAAQAADTFECENQDFGGSLLDSADADFEPRSEPLAFGGAFLTASEGIRSDHVYIPIAASVSGITGRSLRLALIRDDILGNGEDDTEESPIHLPSISKDDQAYWTNNGGPIQQICFASTSGYASTWMAVRLLCSTTICHPLIHEGLMPPRRETYSAPSGALYRSRLDANPVITIPMSRTGGHPHADITFHPRDYSRIAVIDEHGNWSVWSLEEERQESSYPRFHASLFGCGKIWTWDFEKRWRGSPPYHDRWHRIFWCATTENQSEGFFVCNRRTAAVYANSGDLLALLDLRLGHARENQWILDVKPITSIPGHYLVLTTSYLFWMSLGDRQSDKLGNTQNATHILLAWQHFRDGGDRTLHLVSLETGSSKPQFNLPLEYVLTLNSYCGAYRILPC